jgi:hypothetical protein
MNFDSRHSLRNSILARWAFLTPSLRRSPMAA